MRAKIISRMGGAALAALALLTLPAQNANAWQTAHGDPDNSGFAAVKTAPAASGKKVPLLGSMARGAGPVVAPDGTVYVGNEQGRLMSFKPDGTPGWNRTLPGGQMILASPALGSDGTIYVVGVSPAAEQAGTKTKRFDATLNRFNSGGAFLGQTKLPDHNGNGAAAAAPPNIWRFNGTELVILPAAYPGSFGGATDIRLLAFTTSGSIAADVVASTIAATTSGGTPMPSWAMPVCMIPPVLPFCLAEPEFTELPVAAVPPLPGVGIYTNPRGGTPFILLSDHNKDLVVMTFSGGTFTENVRVHEKNRFMRSAPAFLADGRSIIGVEEIKHTDTGAEIGGGKGGAIFSGPNLTKTAPLTGLPQIYATPTRLPDGRVFLVGAPGEMALWSADKVVARVPVAGRSIASVAASYTHLFVASRKALTTFNPDNLAEVARFNWNEGGESSPVIGPQGHVYAIADDAMFVFPPTTATPRTAENSGAESPQNGGIFQAPEVPAPVGQKTGIFQAQEIPAPIGQKTGIFQAEGIPVPASQTGGETGTTEEAKQAMSYEPPLSKNGNRLFACLELDGDDCGKKDHSEIARQYCVKEGYGAVKDYDVETRKGKAETLGGDEYCSKKKCKVFEEIICKM